MYGVSGVQNAAGVDAFQTIAVLDYENSNNFWYCRADFIIKGTIVYNKKTFLIVPAIIPGILNSDKFEPFKADKKIGTSSDGYYVYSLKNPQKPDELAVDIPQMTCADFLGKNNLYPLAIPQ